jgi:glycosyltransferase involved in cell wall biosynthesis
MSRISIIVPVYNAKKTINRCIESLRNQTFDDIEIILVNDGSKDNSRIICDKYAAEDNRIVVIHKVNQGVSKARNTGIERATSEYIMFVDSDDYIKSNMCEVLLNSIDNTEYEVAMGGYERDFIFNGDITKTITTIPNIESIKSLSQYRNNWSSLFEKALFNAPWGKLYKASCIKNNGILFNESLSCGEDLLFNLQVFSDVYKIAISNEVFYVYECSEKESLTTKFDSEKYINDRFLYNRTLDYLKNINMINICKHSVALIYMRSCFRTFEQMFFTNNILNPKEIKNRVKEIINCSETMDAIYNSNHKGFESIVYSFILKIKSYLIVWLFTKIRFIYKGLARKGFK